MRWSFRTIEWKSSNVLISVHISKGGDGAHSHPPNKAQEPVFLLERCCDAAAAPPWLKLRPPPRIRRFIGWIARWAGRRVQSAGVKRTRMDLVFVSPLAMFLTLSFFFFDKVGCGQNIKRFCSQTPYVDKYGLWKNKKRCGPIWGGRFSFSAFAQFSWKKPSIYHSKAII